MKFLQIRTARSTEFAMTQPIAMAFNSHFMHRLRQIKKISFRLSRIPQMQEVLKSSRVARTGQSFTVISDPRAVFHQGISR